MPVKKIIVIDDEKDLVFLMKEMLKVLPGVEVQTAADGKEGLALCQEVGPDLVFLDYVMPKMKGDEVLRRLNEDPRLKGTAVVIMSGLGEAVYFEGLDASIDLAADLNLGPDGEIPVPDVARDQGVVGVLPKPFTRERLMAMVERALRQNPDRKT